MIRNYDCHNCIFIKNKTIGLSTVLFYTFRQGIQVIFSRITHMLFKVELFISSRACWTVYISYSNFGIRVHKTTFTEDDDLQYTCRNVYIYIYNKNVANL